VGVADAGFAAHAPLRLSAQKCHSSGGAMPRTRPCTTGQHRRELVHHRPEACDYRRARSQPDGRRQDDWVFTRRATLHKLGDVTMVWSKQRRNAGPQGVKLLVPNRTNASVGAIGSISAWR
jgi:hypothetical protein